MGRPPELRDVCGCDCGPVVYQGGTACPVPVPVPGDTAGPVGAERYGVPEDPRGAVSGAGAGGMMGASAGAGAKAVAVPEEASSRLGGDSLALGRVRRGPTERLGGPGGRSRGDASSGFTEKVKT